MSPQASIIDVNESNLHQTLEQSMSVPVMFYFWSERSQHCLVLGPILAGFTGSLPALAVAVVLALTILA